jgi:uncharacterized protein HemX
MFSFLFHRLTGPIASGLAVALAIALATVTLTKNGQIRELRGQVETVTKQRDDARRDLVQCRANRVTLEGAIQRQNAALEAARLQGEARAAELVRVAERARVDAQSARARANGILARRGTGNHCADAEALIREAIR